MHIQIEIFHSPDWYNNSAGILWLCRAGISQSTIHIIELQRSEPRSCATVVDIELMKKFPNRDSDWFSNARDSI
jgi:hypothetical protein